MNDVLDEMLWEAIPKSRPKEPKPRKRRSQQKAPASINGRSADIEDSDFAGTFDEDGNDDDDDDNDDRYQSIYTSSSSSRPANAAGSPSTATNNNLNDEEGSQDSSGHQNENSQGMMVIALSYLRHFISYIYIIFMWLYYFVD